MNKLLFASAAALLALMWQPAPLSAQDAYHGGPVDARQHGYEHGYRDGFAFGRDTQASNREQDMVNQRLRTADKDYQEGFGSREQYRDGYTEGFRSGMTDARSGNRSRLEELFRPKDPNYEPDRRSRDDRVDGIYSQNRWPATHIASDIGYRDGFDAAQRDRQQGRMSRPRRHAAWKNGMHGYDNQGASKDQYRNAYRAAFENGYRDGFGNYR